MRRGNGREERQRGRRDGTGSPCERSQESLRRAAQGSVVVGCNLSLTRTFSDALSSACVGVCHCM